MPAVQLDPKPSDTYQNAAHETAIYPRNVAYLYTALGLCGEAGEVAEQIKKAYRDNGGYITQAQQKEIEKELGDVLWYVAMLAWELRISLGHLAQANLDKLADRASRDVLHGEGDSR